MKFWEFSTRCLASKMMHSKGFRELDLNVVFLKLHNYILLTIYVYVTHSILKTQRLNLV